MNVLKWIYIVLCLQISCFNALNGAATPEHSNIIKVRINDGLFSLEKSILSKMPYFRALLNPYAYLQKIRMYHDYQKDLMDHAISAQSQPDVLLNIPTNISNDHMQFFYHQLGRIPEREDITIDMVVNEIRNDPQVAPLHIKELLKSAEKLLTVQSIPTAIDQLWISMIERGLIRPDGKIARAFFSPKDRLLETILGLIKAEKKQIRLACYFMTNKEILCELARARQRGVAVEVVVDKNSPFEGINIRNAGLYSHVWSRKWFGTEPIMHNKFFVFDDNIQNQSILVTGSANCTWSAQEKNEENIVVMNDKKLTAAFEKRFYQLIFFSAHLDPASWEDAKDYIDDCTQINTLHLERFAPQAYLLWQALARLCAIYLNQGLIDIFRLTDATKEQIIKQYNMITSQ